MYEGCGLKYRVIERLFGRDLKMFQTEPRLLLGCKEESKPKIKQFSSLVGLTCCAANENGVPWPTASFVSTFWMTMNLSGSASRFG